MASGGCRPETHSSSSSLDWSGILQEQPMRLVKVPTCLWQPWSGASGSGQVGKLQMARNPGKSGLFFLCTRNSPEFRTPDTPGHSALPGSIRCWGGEGGGERAGPRCAGRGRSGSDRLSLEGQWCSNWNADLPPKRMRTERSHSLARTVQILGMPGATNCKPATNHPCNMEYEKKKKEDGKRVRANKDQGLALLFAAFEEHQCYCMKDLVGVTLQPVLDPKGFLHEGAVRVAQGPHKRAWKLKAQDRHCPAAATGPGDRLHPGKAAPPPTELGSASLLLMTAMSCKSMFEFAFLSMMHEAICG